MLSGISKVVDSTSTTGSTTMRPKFEIESESESDGNDNDDDEDETDSDMDSSLLGKLPLTGLMTSPPINATNDDTTVAHNNTTIPGTVEDGNR